MDAKEKSEIGEAVMEIRKKLWNKKNILRGVCVILIMLILGGVWISGYYSAKQKAEKEVIVLNPVNSEIVSKVISEKTTEIGELATAEYAFTTAARFTDTKHIAVLPASWTQKSFIQKWDGVIKAGIRLENVDVSVKNAVVTITLPHAEILSYEDDKNSVEILDEKSGLFNPISVNDKVKFDKTMEDDMRKRALDSGLLNKAEQNAENVISNLLRASVKGINEYEIRFEYLEK